MASVLLVGNGAREHAIAKALIESPNGIELYSFMSAKNPGIARLSAGIQIGDTCDGKLVSDYASKIKADLAVVGPEAPLAAGVADALSEVGVPCCGPSQTAAQLESDKSFMRDLLDKHKVKGNALYGIFTEVDEAMDFVESEGIEFAVKPAGLTGGKGVKIMGEHLNDLSETRTYVAEILKQGVGKIPRVVLEERLVGEEFTLQGFVDGTRVVGTPMVQDHKRAYEGDMGPNTGGMGSYSNKGLIIPFLTQEDYDDGLEVMQATVKAVKEETGVEYRGFLYGQFMASKDGIKVIEFNARLGDPEAMNILSILDDDFLEVCSGIANGCVKPNVKFKEKATVCKYLVPAGYPDNPKNHVRVDVDEDAIKALGGVTYYASVSEEDGVIYTSKSRAIAVTGVADSITEAEQVAEKSMQHVKGDLFHRKDIGTQALIQKRIEHMKELRR